MNNSSPFSSTKQKKKLQFAQVLELPPEPFKPIKPHLSRASAKALVDASCSTSELLWLERWLESYARTRSLPPQCYGVNAFDALTAILPPEEMLKCLEAVRKDYHQSHPKQDHQKESFQFLLDAGASDPYAFKNELCS